MIHTKIGSRHKLLQDFSPLIWAAQHSSGVFPNTLLPWLASLYLTYLFIFLYYLPKPLSYNRTCPYYIWTCPSEGRKKEIGQSRDGCKKEEKASEYQNTEDFMLFIISVEMHINRCQPFHMPHSDFQRFIHT